MVRVYTDIWNGFQFRAPVYLDEHFEPHKFDLVKWEEVTPHEVIDWVTGKKKMMTKHCFSIGILTWDKKEYDFEFESVGLRYLKHRVDGLEKFILDFCEMMRKELDDDYEDDDEF